MKISSVSFFVFNLGAAVVSAQTDSVSLFQCFQSARQHAAITSQIELQNEIAGLKMTNDWVTNLPSVSAYGKAWYQSDAISVNLPGGMGIEIDPFQYNIGIEADQKLFDGGIARKSRDLDKASHVSETSRIETQLYQLNNQTVQYFFNSMLLFRNEEVVRLKEEILEKRIAELQSAFDNGVIPRNELDKMKAEALTTRQQKLEIEKARLQSINSLQVLTGLSIEPGTHLYVPDSIYQVETAERPEYRYFDAETQRLQSLISLKSRQNLPKLYAYGQLGYSYPGLNMFENNADYYYIVGAKLSWPIFDWRQTKRETQVIEKQQDIITTNRDDFNQKMQLSMEHENIEQEKLNELIAMDDSILVQRNSIAEGSASALKNGVITSTAYLEDLNAEIAARLQMETHKIQLLGSVVKLYLLKGIAIGNL
jgi:outer membrane protein TolC